MDEREFRLPAWARQLITDLRRQVNDAVEPMIREVAKLRSQAELNRVRYEAMLELLDCAARGGHRTSQEIMDIIGSHDLMLVPKGVS